MRDYVYTVWLQDSDLPSDEQDFEFPACFRVTAISEDAALEWGDVLARSFCSRRSEMTFLSSSAELANLSDPEVVALPRIEHGRMADDNEIGW